MILTTLADAELAIPGYPGMKTPWYNERAINSDILTIAVGDSWTWGDSLDHDHRQKYIYGNLLAEKFNSDFINIGLCGGSNLHILRYLDQVLTHLAKEYKTIRVFFTLTESGRELLNGFLDQHAHYEEWRGTDWPLYDEIIHGTAKDDALSIMFNDLGHNYFSCQIRLFIKLKTAQSLKELCELYEQFTFQEIKNYFDQCKLNVEWHIGRNFTCTFESNKSIVPAKCLIDKSWVDIIARQGNLLPYPTNVYVMSQMGVDPMIKFSDHIHKGKFKKEWIDFLTASESGIDWLDASPYNAHKATKHPLTQAHAWWAEYLYENTKERNLI